MSSQQPSPAQQASEPASSPSILEQIEWRQAEVASRYKPVMEIEDQLERFKLLEKFIKTVLVENQDYGSVPGVEKPFLFKPGAQKLCMLFGYSPHYDTRVMIEDWGGDKYNEPLFYYQYCCTLFKDQAAVGEGIGSANSWESKYRYRWVSESFLTPNQKRDKERLLRRDATIREPAFAVDKAETGGKYGKPAEYWQRWRLAIESGEAKKIDMKKKDGGKMPGWELPSILYRVPNDEFANVINTCQKIGQKRAYVEATLSATGASQFFTQDEDAVQGMPDIPGDLPSEGDTAGIDTGGHPVGTQAAADAVRDRKLAEKKEEQKKVDHDRAGRFDVLKEFSKMKDAIGEDAYRKILNAAGYKKSSDIKIATDAGYQEARVIWSKMESYRKSMPAVNTEPEPASEKPKEEVPPSLERFPDNPTDPEYRVLGILYRYDEASGNYKLVDESKPAPAEAPEAKE